MAAIDIIRNRSNEPASKPESFDKQFARNIAQFALESHFGPSESTKLVTGVVVGGIGASLLYILFFRKRK